jgi:hypothetical protein
MLRLLLLDEGTPLVMTGVAILVGAVAFLALIARSATRPGASLGTRLLSTAVLWILCGASALYTLGIGLVDAIPWSVTIPLLFFGVSCLVTYKVATASRVPPK